MVRTCKKTSEAVESSFCSRDSQYVHSSDCRKPKRISYSNQSLIDLLNSNLEQRSLEELSENRDESGVSFVYRLLNLKCPSKYRSFKKLPKPLFKLFNVEKVDRKGKEQLQEAFLLYIQKQQIMRYNTERSNP